MRRLLFLPLSLVVLAACGKTETITDRIDSNTRSYWQASCMNVEHDLFVDGKCFKNVRGMRDFYIHLKQTNSILFIVDEKDYSITYHIYNLDTRQDLTIKETGISLFGHTMGDLDTRDSVEELGNGNLILLTRSFDESMDYKYCDYLDPVKAQVVGQKKYCYDKKGKLIKEEGNSPPPDFFPTKKAIDQ